MKRAFLQRFDVAPHHRVGAVGSAVDLAALERDVELRAAKADHESGILESHEIGHDARAGIDGVTDGLRAESKPRCRAQFLQAIEPGFSPGEKYIRIAAFRRAKINEFIEI